MKEALKKFSERARNVGIKVMGIWTVIFLTIAYFTVFAITALILKVFGKNQLIKFNRHQASYWYPRPQMKHTIEELKKQF